MKKTKLKKDLAILLDYLWHDEKRHYNEGLTRKHIFMTMKRLARGIGYKKGMNEGSTL